MKTIGLIGGMSWESSLLYYQIINEAVRDRLGGLHSADCLMVSFDFAEIEAYQMAGDWEKAGHRLSEAARKLEAAGADCVVICTNTMHKLADVVTASLDIPLIHIADATAEAIKARGFRTVALLGTGFTMRESFYKGRLEKVHELTVLVPDEAGQSDIHRVIYDELVCGVVNEASRALYVEQIKRLQARGAEAVILGCTEIGILIKPEDSPIPTFDTTELHALAAVDFALEAE